MSLNTNEDACKAIPYLLDVQAKLAGISMRSLGDKITSPKDKRDEIIAALNLLFTGI